MLNGKLSSDLARYACGDLVYCRRRSSWQAKRALTRQALADDQLFVSAITFWEIALLIAKQRLDAMDNSAEQRNRILAAGIQEVPLTGDIAILAVDLQTSMPTRRIDSLLRPRLPMIPRW
jgi:PIN domain nuclease of toxin-antitoxin system